MKNHKFEVFYTFLVNFTSLESLSLRYCLQFYNEATRNVLYRSVLKKIKQGSDVNSRALPPSDPQNPPRPSPDDPAIDQSQFAHTDSYNTYMNDIVLDMTNLRAEISIYQESAKDAEETASTTLSQEVEDEEITDLAEYKAVISLLGELQLDPNVIMNDGVTNWDISTYMLDILDEMEDTVEILYSLHKTSSQEEQDVYMFDLKDSSAQFNYLLDLKVDELSD